jgi:RNA polymerase sigma-70 factor (ECF subfamily)
MTTDESLMLDFQSGSRAAFEELYARYCGPLYGFFRRRVENHGRAEDLAQETFLVVIRNAVRYEPRSLVRTYLYGIALKLLAAERRKRSRDALPEEAAAEPATTDASEAALWVQQAMAKLSDTEREILMLREYEQLSYAEIAEMLRLPVNTVRSRLFRARMALKGMLEPKSARHQPDTTRENSATSAAAASDSAIKGKV